MGNLRKTNQSPLPKRQDRWSRLGWQDVANSKRGKETRRWQRIYCYHPGDHHQIKTRTRFASSAQSRRSKALNDQFAVEYTYNSNAIEGNTLTLRETDLVLRGLTIDKKPLKDHLDIVGRKEAFDYVSQLVKDKEPLTERVIKQIHFLVLGRDIQNRGVYRNVPVYISGAKTQTAEPVLIPEKIQELLEWYQSDTQDDFLTKIALFHLRFESIHPFIDGNGRTGRLLVNLELMKLGYPPIDIRFTDRNAYYNAFDFYAETGSPKAMFKLVAKYLTERLKRYIETVKTAEQVAKQRQTVE